MICIKACDFMNEAKQILVHSLSIMIELINSTKSNVSIFVLFDFND